MGLGVEEFSGVKPVSGNAEEETQTSASILCLAPDNGRAYCAFSCSVLLMSFSLLQIGTQNSLEILEDPKAEVVDEIAAKLGLRKVRMLSDLMRLCLAMKKVVGSSLQLHGVVRDGLGIPEI